MKLIDASIFSDYPPKGATGFVYSFVACRPDVCNGTPILTHSDFLSRLVPLLMPNCYDKKTFEVKRIK